MDRTDLQKKRQVIDEILEEIGRYEAANGEMPLEILSRKFSKRCISIGGLRRMLSELELDGSLELSVLKSGRSFITRNLRKVG